MEAADLRGHHEIAGTVADGDGVLGTQSPPGEVICDRPALVDAIRHQVVDVQHVDVETRRRARREHAVVVQAHPRRALPGEPGVDLGDVGLPAQHHVELVPEMPGIVELEPAREPVQHPFDEVSRDGVVLLGHRSAKQVAPPPPVPGDHRAEFRDVAVRAEDPRRLEQLRL